MSNRTTTITDGDDVLLDRDVMFAVQHGQHVELWLPKGTRCTVDEVTSDHVYLVVHEAPAHVVDWCGGPGRDLSPINSDDGYVVAIDRNDDADALIALAD
jgi:hypothetical protein